MASTKSGGRFPVSGWESEDEIAIREKHPEFLAPGDRGTDGAILVFLPARRRWQMVVKHVRRDAPPGGQSCEDCSAEFTS
ncbi:MAG TPA: hypothetical protein VHC69_05190 [Polyangiaceae bacterium]|nr:hypothetical protein [Polyangiaceae bacterium]